MKLMLLAVASLILFCSTVFAVEPIPDKLVVLTFDDASKSHFTIVGPLLKKYKFGATFFVTEGFDMVTNKRDYMTWEEIAGLHHDGFEIGNHTRDHMGVTDKSVVNLVEQVEAINERCKAHGIPAPVSFAYPGNAITKDAIRVLAHLGIKFARRGGAPEFPYKEGRGFAFESGLDHPLLIPSAGDARPGWTLDDFKRAVNQANNGKIAVLQFHGVPDTAHDWVATSKKQFESYLQYLADNRYQVIAIRDLSRYVDPAKAPDDMWGIIEARQQQLRATQHEPDKRQSK
jgi:peptidoglycan/xylan/chitin deacetylase (PgdA/CDA1 family)